MRYVIGEIGYFIYYGTDEDMLKRNGDKVEIVSEFAFTDEIISKIGRMFIVEFPDGECRNVYESELNGIDFDGDRKPSLEESIGFMERDAEYV